MVYSPITAAAAILDGLDELRAARAERERFDYEAPDHVERRLESAVIRIGEGLAYAQGLAEDKREAVQRAELDAVLGDHYAYGSND